MIANGTELGASSPAVRRYEITMTAKRLERIFFAALLATGLACLILATVTQPERLVSSSSVLIGLAGIVQLEISGLFEQWLEKYGDEEKYPYGPPSRITRQIIDNPDRPIWTWLRNTALFEKRTGFELIVLGCVLQLISIWI